MKSVAQRRRRRGGGGILRWRAECPYCGSQFARREYFHSGQRRCGGCGALLKPAEPANMMGNLFFGIPLGLAIVSVMFYLQAHGAPTIEAKLKIALAIAAILVVFLGVAAWAWPIITPFEPPLSRCWHCNIELVHRFPLCPRCNAPAQPLPQVHVAQLRACGSDESPATPGSP
jgi:hypothetical protein